MIAQTIYLKIILTDFLLNIIGRGGILSLSDVRMSTINTSRHTPYNCKLWYPARMGGVNCASGIGREKSSVQNFDTGSPQAKIAVLSQVYGIE